MKLILAAVLASASAMTKPRTLAGPATPTYAALAVRGGGVSKADYVKAVTGVYALRVAAS